MSNILVLTDSNSGITQAEAKQLGVEVIPMPFMVNGECYYEDINLTQSQFYSLLAQDVNVSTSQPALGLLREAFIEYLKSYDEIVYIPMSSGLSMSCYSAKALVQEEFSDRIFVVDNQHISVTQKRSVLDALALVNEGYSGSEIRDMLERNKKLSSIYIMVDTLKYLRKGGRITPAVAVMGSLLKIKPILQIHGDKLDKWKQTRTLENAKRLMLDKAAEDILELTTVDNRKDNIYIDVAYTYDDKEALKLRDEITNRFGVENVFVNPLSLSVSCHIGPNALAIAVTKKTLPDYNMN